mmetsp:Transcript_31754/g.69396  ORF Transcript_31754/g.69396 Transcript_31754/m.69396 type:complete len:459 (-) Transcript_31754:120-1496(-)
MAAGSLRALLAALLVNSFPALHVSSIRESSESGDSNDHFRRSSGQPIQSGDRIFLQGHAGQYLLADANGVLADLADHRGQLGITIMKDEPGSIVSGDSIFLQTPSGNFVDVEEGQVRARWNDRGQFQRMTIFKQGSGPILSEDTILLQASNGVVLHHEGKRLVGKGDSDDTWRLIIRRLPYGSLHSVVGADGAVMIALQREGSERRSLRAMDALAAAGIFPWEMAATEAARAPSAQLKLTCPLESDEGSAGWCADMGRESQPGCQSQIEQAVADSHRRALLAALKRDQSASPWTAILEEDVLPVLADGFDDAFAKAWSKVPAEAKLVRLGWCTFESDLGQIDDEALDENGSFKLVRKRWWTDGEGSKHYYTGGCSSAYIVHRSLISEMLKIFPCCCAFDCCLESQLFYAPSKLGESGEFGRWRGHDIMIDIDLRSGGHFGSGSDFNQSGILIQDNRIL